MQYIIKADEKEWGSRNIPKKRKYSFGEIDDRIGDIVMEFKFHSSSSRFLSKYTIIPLFLSELEDFLGEVNSDHPSIWRIGFAPFAYGMLSGNGMLISSRGEKEFSSYIYDHMNFGELSSLQEKLSRDIWRYGSLERIGG